MNEALSTLLVMWGFVSLIWVLLLKSSIKDKREEFYNYVAHHQHFISLYVEAANQNRRLIKQNQNYKHAVADSIFYPNETSLVDVSEWYKKYNINPKLCAEDISSELEVEHFKKKDQHDTRQSRHILTN